MAGVGGQRALCLTGVLLGWALVAPSSRDAPRPRNLLLITLDTMRADRLPSYGFHDYTTPAISRIADEGMVVQEAFQLSR